jgi:hypothetical protein
MAAPDSKGGSRPTYDGASEVTFLAIGTISLMALVWFLVWLANVPSRAAFGFTVIGIASLVLAVTLVLPWRTVFGLAGGFFVFLGREFRIRLSGKAGERSDDDRRRSRNSRRSNLQSATKRRVDRSAIGLWVPYVVNLIGVGWLIYYSGGIVDSPFVAIPVIMFTLVVLLIDPPNSKTSPEGKGSTAALTGREPRPPIWPFVVLGVVALVFFAAMTLLNTWAPAHLTSSPADGAEILVTLATASVGIVLAAVARWSILQDLVKQ